MDLLDKAGFTTMRTRVLAVFAVVGVGITLGLLLAPAFVTMQIPPPPVIKTVEVHTDDVLDTGAGCVYTWDGTIYFWSRENLAITREERCPERRVARTRYTQSLQSPFILDNK